MNSLLGESFTTLWWLHCLSDGCVRFHFSCWHCWRNDIYSSNAFQIELRFFYFNPVLMILYIKVATDILHICLTSADWRRSISYERLAAEVHQVLHSRSAVGKNSVTTRAQSIQRIQGTLSPCELMLPFGDMSARERELLVQSASLPTDREIQVFGELSEQMRTHHANIAKRDGKSHQKLAEETCSS